MYMGFETLYGDDVECYADLILKSISQFIAGSLARLRASMPPSR